MFNTNHFIFKMFDGLNFYDIDNFNQQLYNKPNNTDYIYGKKWEIIVLFFVLTNKKD